VQKVASISEGALSISEEDHTLFGLIKAVFLIVLSEFMRSMGKLTLVAIRTKSMFDELLTQLKFLFVMRPERGIFT